jgi:YbbR domain-containing protein
MVLVNKPISSLKVKVESQGFQMMTIALRNNKQVRIDLSKIELHRTPYKRWVASIPSHLFANEISTQLGVDPIGSKVRPDSIYFVFDSLITKTLPVVIKSKLSFMEGNTLWGDLVVDPKMVEVSGPALKLNSTKFVVADSLILEQIGEDFSKKLKLLKPGNLVSMNPTNVTVSAKVTKFSEFTSEAPLRVQTNIPDLKIKLFPPKVKITYSIPIPEYDNISDSSFIVSVNIDSLDVLKGSFLIPKIVRKPDVVRSAYLDVDRVEFIIIKK